MSAHFLVKNYQGLWHFMCEIKYNSQTILRRVGGLILLTFLIQTFFQKMPLYPNIQHIIVHYRHKWVKIDAIYKKVTDAVNISLEMLLYLL